jgi:predicted transcriptional regulator
MDEKCIRAILNLYVNPYSTGKEIAKNTDLSEPDVSIRLNMLKKENIVDNIMCKPQKDKNYSGKCWFIVDRFATLEKAVGVLNAQKQNIIKKIEDLMDQYSMLDTCGTESSRGFFAFADILYMICPPCIDPGKMNEAMLCHSNIFELERVYYETKIAPYENAIESAKTQKEKDIAIKKKEAEDVRILSSVFAPSIVDTSKQFGDYTEKDEEWVDFILKVRIAAHTSNTPP